MNVENTQAEFDFGKWKAVKNHWSKHVYHIEWTTNHCSLNRNQRERYGITSPYHSKINAERLADQLNRDQVKYEETPEDELFQDDGGYNTFNPRGVRFFCDLTVHEKIIYRGNRTLEHGRIYLIGLYNYHHLPIDACRAFNRKGNLELINHLALNRSKYRSGDTIKWLYGTAQRKVVVGRQREYSKKEGKWIESKGKEEIIPATSGVYGVGGVPFWKMKQPKIKN